MPPKKNLRDSAAEIAFGVLPDLVGYQFRLAPIAIFRPFSPSLGSHEVIPGLFGVLVSIDANPGMKQSELARATHLDRSTVVSQIDNPERRALVERRSVATDRRSNALQLTADGRTLLKKLRRLVDEHEQRLTENLSEKEQATLVRLLQNIFPEQRCTRPKPQKIRS